MVMTTVTSGRHAEPVTEPAEPEVPERASRRIYSAQYKLRILAEYERRDRDGKGAGGRSLRSCRRGCSLEQAELLLHLGRDGLDDLTERV